MQPHMKSLVMHAALVPMCSSENRCRMRYLSNVIEERPMDPPPQRHSLYVHDMDTSPVYSEYRPTWSNRSVFRSWGNKPVGHLEFRRGRIIMIKRYCKI